MTEPNHLRGNALRGRSLSVVTEALSRVRDAGLERALDPKNVAKGPWERMTIGDLFDLLAEEVDELEQAFDDGDVAEIVREAGDVVWVVAMICDVAVRGRR